MNTYILGGATTKFGELWNMSPRMLAKQAIDKALSESRLEASEIDAVFVGNMLSEMLGNQANLGSFISEELGVFRPAFHIEGACASGGLALHNAINSLKAGVYKNALVLGIEKMTDSSQEDVMAGLMSAGSESERQSGATFPGIYALMAQSYMETHNVTEEDLAGVPVKNHYHGSLNPNAQFRKSITVKDVMNSTRIADPLKLLDCSPVSDGAATIIISSDEKHKNNAAITASEIDTDTLALSDRKSFTTLEAVKRASKRAYAKTGIKSTDIQVAEIHDCFSIAEVIAVEDLGFSKIGYGAKDIFAGRYTLNKGSITTNPSGGLKACGHPVGATGIKQIVELNQQLKGVADERQVKNAKIGLAHNVGGSGTVAAIHILQI